MQLYTAFVYKQNQEGYKTSILYDFGYWNRNDKGKIEKAEMKFLKFCWHYAIRDATVRSELQKEKGNGRRTEKWGNRLLRRGACLTEQVDKLAVGMFDVGREDGRLVYEDFHASGRDPTGRP
jgi:hypothetical protein